MRKLWHSTIFSELEVIKKFLAWKNPFSEVDWSENLDSQEDTVNDSQECQEEMNTATSVNKDREEKEQTLESLREAVSNIVDKVEDRFEEVQ